MLIFVISMSYNGKIQALINLLDDPDQQVFSVVKGELLDIGHQVVPLLEDAWDLSYDVTFQNRVEDIIHQIHFELVKDEIIKWKDNPERSLLYGAYLIAKYQYPEITYDSIESFVAQLTQDIWIEMNPNLTAMEKVRVINEIFFNVHGFSGNKKNFHSAQNSYINNVIEVKKGNPISLSLLYAEIASRVKVPIYGVNLPEHFVLAYTTMPIEFLGKVSKKDVLFYINTFNKGTLFEEKEISKFLNQLKVESHEEYFVPCNSVSVIKRILQNLINSYTKSGHFEKSTELEELMNCLEMDASTLS